MAKNNVKKGFASYILILIMAILATFLVLIVVAIFSPFKDILGFKYFTYNDEEYIYRTSIDSKDYSFNFENFEKIKINCNYADVKIERSSDTDTHAVYFENHSVGFARADQDTNFTYEVYYAPENTKELNIDVHEPEGLLFLNKNVSISLLIPVRGPYPELAPFTQSLENTTVEIINTSGNIYIGNKIKPVDHQVDNKACLYVNIGAINIKKTKGQVLFRDYSGADFGDVFIKSDKGTIESTKDLNIKNLNIYATKAKFNFKKVNYSGDTAVLNLGNSKFYATEFSGNVNLTIQNGYFDLDLLKGTLISDNSENRMAKATIYIKEVQGSVALPFAYKSRIDFDKISQGSQLQIRGTDGDINIDELYGSAWIETTKGDINVHTYADDLSVRTTSGDIDVVFDNPELFDGIEITTDSGDVNLQVRSGLAFVLEVYNTKGELIRTREDINIDWLGSKVELPYKFNSGTKKIKITSDESINVSLINNNK